MDRLEMVISLIEEAKVERDRLIAYEKALKKIGYKWCPERYEIEKKFSPTPRKSIVNDNLKIARRILLGEYLKEV